jgi:MFS family permease
MSWQFVSVAVGWELYERTGDPWSLGLVGLAQVVPAMVLTLPAGAIADRFPRRNISAVVHALMALTSVGLALVSWTQAPIELIYVLLVLNGAGRAFSVPAVSAMLAHLLRPEHLANGYAWLTLTSQLANISGPALGGFLLAATGAAAQAYVAAGLAHLVFMLVLSTLPASAPPRSGATPSIGDVFAGVGFIFRNQVFLSAITLDLAAVLLGAAVALLPVFAKDVLDVGPAGLGLLRSSPAVGALLTAFVVTRLPPWQRPGRILLIVVTVFGLATVGFGLSRELWLSMLCLFIAGSVDSISVVIRGTIQQVITPNRLRGRVAAVNSLFISLSNEMGAFRAGATAAFIGVVPSVIWGGIGTVVVAALVAACWPAIRHIGPLHTLRPVEEDAPEPAARPAQA